MTPHERAIATVQALQLRKKKKEELIANYQLERAVYYGNRNSIHRKRRTN